MINKKKNTSINDKNNFIIDRNQLLGSIKNNNLMLILSWCLIIRISYYIDFFVIYTRVMYT